MTPAEVVCDRTPASLVLPDEDEAFGRAEAELDEDEDEDAALDAVTDDCAAVDEEATVEEDIGDTAPWICQPLERVPLG
jgi:hypothetical protein